MDDSYLVSINVRSSVPAYAQIEYQLLFAIASGKLKAGDALPSITKLANRLGANFNTVVKSYRDLQVMGLVHGRQGEGSFVNEGVREQCRKIVKLRMVQRIHETTQESKAAGFPKSVLTAVVNKSMGIDCSPYDDAPETITKMASGKWKPRS